LINSKILIKTPIETQILTDKKQQQLPQHIGS